MDAYSNYILNATDAKLAEMRREAAEYRLSRVARRARRSRSERPRGRLRWGRSHAPTPLVTPAVVLVQPESPAEDEVRRSA